MTNYYIAKKTHACSPLDFALMPKDSPFADRVAINLVSYYDGSTLYSYEPRDEIQVHKKELSAFLHEAISHFEAEEHVSTDHLVIMAHIGDTKIAYVSFENSVRSVGAGCGFETRAEAFVKLIDKLVTLGVGLFLFSEGCRDVRDGVVTFNDRRIPVTPVKKPWLFYRRMFEKQCNLCFIGESPNNSEGNNLAFGVQAFAHESFYDKILSYSPLQLLPKDSRGCGALKILIRVEDREMWVMGVHMPLNFQESEDCNPFTLAISSLKEHVSNYATDVILGDCNTIPGWRYERFVKEMSEGYLLYGDRKYPTFFASYCDGLKEELEKNVLTLVTE